MERNIYKIGKELFITNDEEIKEGDYITDGYRVWKWKDDSSLLGRKKIILTTDQDLIKDSIQAISDEFIELFVKNSSCEEVEVDIMNKGYNKKEDIPYQEFYKIIIPQEEPKIDSIFNEANVRFSETLDKLSDNSLKQETLEEAADIEKIAMDKLKNKWGHLYTFGYPQRPFPTNYENDLNNIKIGLYEGAKWQQEQDKNKYSEEEVLIILDKFLTSMIKGEKTGLLEEWFEHLKKK